MSEDTSAADRRPPEEADALAGCLFERLQELDHLRGWYPIQNGFKSQVIHKEWPETFAQASTGRTDAPLERDASVDE